MWRFRHNHMALMAFSRRFGCRKIDFRTPCQSFGGITANGLNLFVTRNDKNRNIAFGAWLTKLTLYSKVLFEIIFKHWYFDITSHWHGVHYGLMHKMLTRNQNAMVRTPTRAANIFSTITHTIHNDKLTRCKGAVSFCITDASTSKSRTDHGAKYKRTKEGTNERSIERTH